MMLRTLRSYPGSVAVPLRQPSRPPLLPAKPAAETHRPLARVFPSRHPGHLKKFDLADAVASPALAARDPGHLVAARPTARRLLAALESARSVLLVGHVSPDGDCVGSALALGRALRALGKRVDVCVDDELSGFLRQVARRHEVARPQALTQQRWDLGVLVDVGVASRIGAALGLLARADAVAVVDHHIVAPRAEDFGLAPTTPFLSWVEPDFPAAALLISALVRRLLPHARGDELYFPALAGFATDTGWGALPGLDRSFFGYFKHLLLEAAELDMPSLRARLSGFRLPERVAALLAHTARPDELRLPAELRDELERHAACGRGVRQTLLRSPDGRPGLGLITCSADHIDALLQVGRLDDPELVRSDILPPLALERARHLREAGAALTAVLTEAQDGTIDISLRSLDDRARRLAEDLGGGGHDRAAGAHVAEAGLAAVEAMIIFWASDERLI